MGSVRCLSSSVTQGLSPPRRRRKRRVVCAGCRMICVSAACTCVAAVIVLRMPDDERNRTSGVGLGRSAVGPKPPGGGRGRGAAGRAAQGFSWSSVRSGCTGFDGEHGARTSQAWCIRGGCSGGRARRVRCVGRGWRGVRRDFRRSARRQVGRAARCGVRAGVLQDFPAAGEFSAGGSRRVLIRRGLRLQQGRGARGKARRG